MTMDISLSPEWEELVQEKVTSGRYRSPSDVVSEGLRLLKERDEAQDLRLAELRREIAVGLKQLDEGRGVELDEEVLKGIKARGRQRLARLTDSKDK